MQSVTTKPTRRQGKGGKPEKKASRDPAAVAALLMGLKPDQLHDTLCTLAGVEMACLDATVAELARRIADLPDHGRQIVLGQVARIRKGRS